MTDVPRNDSDNRDMEELLRRADFSRETDFKERLWKRLSLRMEEMERQESFAMDLSDDELAQAAGGWHTGGAMDLPVKKIDF